jgi:tRNA (guanine37-N1)-methyltransferase
MDINRELMRLDIIAAVPDLLNSFLEHSIIGRARENGLVQTHIHNLHDYGLGRYRQIDDYPYGGGGGMVIRCEPVAAALEDIIKTSTPDEIIFFTAEGETWHQKLANLFSLKKHLVMVCGHYKGIDERVVEAYATRRISIGPYVLTGGELAAAVVIDSVVRLIPGVLGDEMSALSDSFQDGLLAPPVYTRPEVWRNIKVPEVLLSGDPRKIEEWRLDMAEKRTAQYWRLFRELILSNSTSVY